MRRRLLCSREKEFDFTAKSPFRITVKMDDNMSSGHPIIPGMSLGIRFDDKNGDGNVYTAERTLLTGNGNDYVYEVSKDKINEYINDYDITDKNQYVYMTFANTGNSNIYDIEFNDVTFGSKGEPTGYKITIEQLVSGDGTSAHCIYAYVIPQQFATKLINAGGSVSETIIWAYAKLTAGSLSTGIDSVTPSSFGTQWVQMGGGNPWGSQDVVMAYNANSSTSARTLSYKLANGTAGPSITLSYSQPGTRDIGGGDPDPGTDEKNKSIKLYFNFYPYVNGTGSAKIFGQWYISDKVALENNQNYSRCIIDRSTIVNGGSRRTPDSANNWGQLKSFSDVQYYVDYEMYDSHRYFINNRDGNEAGSNWDIDVPNAQNFYDSVVSWVWNYDGWTYSIIFDFTGKAIPGSGAGGGLLPTDPAL